MLRDATLTDVSFVRDLVVAEAPTGVFAPEMAIPAVARGFDLELRAIVTHRRRLNGAVAQLLIWQPARVLEPVGFVEHGQPS
jgi:hypothetical protein